MTVDLAGRVAAWRREHDDTMHRASDAIAELRAILAEPTQATPRLRLMLTTDEVAAELRCSKASVATLIKSGELPSVKIGGLRRIRRADLDLFVAGLQPSPPGYY